MTGHEYYIKYTKVNGSLPKFREIDKAFFEHIEKLKSFGNKDIIVLRGRNRIYYGIKK